MWQGFLSKDKESCINLVDEAFLGELYKFLLIMPVVLIVTKANAKPQLYVEKCSIYD